MLQGVAHRRAQRPGLSDRPATVPNLTVTIPDSERFVDKPAPPLPAAEDPQLSPTTDICYSPSWSEFGGKKKKKEKLRVEREKKAVEKERKDQEKRLRKAREKESKVARHAPLRSHSAYSIARLTSVLSTPMLPLSTAKHILPAPPESPVRFSNEASSLSDSPRPTAESTRAADQRSVQLYDRPCVVDSYQSTRDDVEIRDDEDEELYEKELITHAYHMTLSNTTTKSIDHVDNDDFVMRPGSQLAQQVIDHPTPPSPASTITPDFSDHTATPHHGSRKSSRRDHKSEKRRSSSVHTAHREQQSGATRQNSKRRNRITYYFSPHRSSKQFPESSNDSSIAKAVESTDLSSTRLSSPIYFQPTPNGEDHSQRCEASEELFSTQAPRPSTRSSLDGVSKALNYVQKQRALQQELQVADFQEKLALSEATKEVAEDGSGDLPVTSEQMNKNSPTPLSEPSELDRQINKVEIDQEECSKEVSSESEEENFVDATERVSHDLKSKDENKKANTYDSTTSQPKGTSVRDKLISFEPIDIEVESPHTVESGFWGPLWPHEINRASIGNALSYPNATPSETVKEMGKHLKPSKETLLKQSTKTLRRRSRSSHRTTDSDLRNSTSTSEKSTSRQSSPGTSLYNSSQSARTPRKLSKSPHRRSKSKSSVTSEPAVETLDPTLDFDFPMPNAIKDKGSETKKTAQKRAHLAEPSDSTAIVKSAPHVASLMKPSLGLDMPDSTDENLVPAPLDSLKRRSDSSRSSPTAGNSDDNPSPDLTDPGIPIKSPERASQRPKTAYSASAPILSGETVIRPVSSGASVSNPSFSTFPSPSYRSHSSTSSGFFPVSTSTAPTTTVNSPLTSTFPRPRPSMRPPPSTTATRKRSMHPLGASSLSASSSSLSVATHKPVAKLFVICCGCQFWHDLPAKVYQTMTKPRNLVADNDTLRLLGANDETAEGDHVPHPLKSNAVELEPGVKCPWCNHGMHSSCCAGWTTVVYLHERHH
ncbi:MAG: hypothetical protein M1814_005695 [Vezdaea aestivalis]|nr:MAG: hypothetical protein M1814_005695 [Vezdaea aestivalis]